MSPRVMFQDVMDVDQSLPVSRVSTPGFAIGDTSYKDRPAGEPS